jgi:UDP-glucose 4-epimerase
VRALVAGARGFLGGSVAQHLEARGTPVLAVTGPGKGDDGARAYCPGLYGTLIDELAPGGLVVYAAGTALPRDGRSLEEALARDISPFVELLAALTGRGQPVTVLLFSSGGTVYGPAEPGQALTERSATRPTTVYGRSRLALEEALNRAAERSPGIRPMIFRLSNLYGPGQRLTGGSTFVLRAVRAAAGYEPLRLLGSGHQTKDFLFVDDLLAAVDALLALPPEQAFPDPRFNVCAGRSHSLRQVLQEVRAVTGRPVPVEWAAAASEDTPRVRLSAEKAARELGWESRVALAEGIRRLWEWVRTRTPGEAPPCGS